MTSIRRKDRGTKLTTCMHLKEDPSKQRTSFDY